MGEFTHMDGSRVGSETGRENSPKALAEMLGEILTPAWEASEALRVERRVERRVGALAANLDCTAGIVANTRTEVDEMRDASDASSRRRALIGKFKGPLSTERMRASSRPLAFKSLKPAQRNTHAPHWKREFLILNGHCALGCRFF